MTRLQPVLGALELAKHPAHPRVVGDGLFRLAEGAAVALGIFQDSGTRSAVKQAHEPT
jgi:hypothetical protein